MMPILQLMDWAVFTCSLLLLFQAGDDLIRRERKALKMTESIERVIKFQTLTEMFYKPLDAVIWAQCVLSGKKPAGPQLF